MYATVSTGSSMSEIITFTQFTFGYATINTSNNA